MRKFAAIALLAAAIGILGFVFSGKDRVPPLRVSCSADFERALLDVARQYEREFGIAIELGEEAPELVVGPTPDLVAGRKEGVLREIIPLATLRHGRIDLSIGAAVPADCPRPADALKFARYLAAPEKGNRILAAAGWKPVPGDTWAEKPDLILYSGGVNRPAVEALLESFSEREGVSMTTVFNGCGILCAAMKAMTNEENPRFPDAYFACDLCFVPPVAEHFGEVVLLTETDIGIAVPRGNPKNVKTLADLARPDLKVGLCNQKQSTLGYMTQGILTSSGLEKSIRKNVSVEVPTADFLITQMRSGALDAAIVYRVNAELQKEHIEFLPIKHEGARAVQPFSVRGDTGKRQLAERLRDHFLAHPEAFEETGFKWRGNEGILKSSEIEIPEWLKP